MSDKTPQNESGNELDGDPTKNPSGNEPQDDGDLPEDPDELKELIQKERKEKASALAQKEHFREKFDKVKSSFDEPDDKPEKQPKNMDDDTWKETIDFIVSNKDYDKEDVQLLHKLRSEDESLEEAAKKYSHVVEANQKKRQDERKPTGPSSPRGTSSDSMPTNEEIAKMSPEEHAEFEKKFYERRAGNSGV